MRLFAAIVLVVLLLLLFMFFRRRGATENSRPNERRQLPIDNTKKFHAVSLKFASSACAAAKAMEGRRFLSSAAPRIPLPECDVLECKCRFVHHKDRRSGDERRTPFGQGFGGGTTGSYEEEQRKRGERREDPPEDPFS